MALKPGDEAPDFELPSHTGDKVRLSNYRGRVVVLYFYPRAMTPGCTREGIRFNELYNEFEKLGAVVLGVSTDPVDKNRKFAEKYGFQFPLLSDVDGKVSELYGVLEVRGKGVKSSRRTTFIINAEGRIARILENIRPAEKHADLALEEVRKLSK
ncbi:MAG: peroxiredoxin [Desulfurococcales archaeon]|nr:peroxiredoxin [Desulfurococcales archaeon]